MRPRIKLIAVDLGDTLTTASGQMHPHSAAMLHRACGDGIHVVLATSRPRAAAEAAAAELGLTSPLIGTNGAQVWGSPGGEVWAEYPLEPHTAERIRTHAAQHGWPLDSSPYGLVCTQPEGIAGLHTLCGEELEGRCRTELFYNGRGALTSLLIVAPEANKRTALTLILKRLKLKGKHVLAIGDNHNDIPMFSLAETSVAVGNAPIAVQVSATTVGPRADEGGVGWAVERFIYEV